MGALSIHDKESLSEIVNDNVANELVRGWLIISKDVIYKHVLLKDVVFDLHTTPTFFADGCDDLPVLIPFEGGTGKRSSGVVGCFYTIKKLIPTFVNVNLIEHCKHLVILIHNLNVFEVWAESQGILSFRLLIELYSRFMS
jgi:hypothetical protein